jgi:hypothetical protein
MSDDPVLFILYCAGGFIVLPLLGYLLLYCVLWLAPWEDKKAFEVVDEVLSLAPPRVERKKTLKLIPKKPASQASSSEDFWAPPVDRE